MGYLIQLDVFKRKFICFVFCFSINLSKLKFTQLTSSFVLNLFLSWLIVCVCLNIKIPFIFILQHFIAEVDMKKLFAFYQLSCPVQSGSVEFCYIHPISSCLRIQLAISWDLSFADQQTFSCIFLHFYNLNIWSMFMRY